MSHIDLFYQNVRGLRTKADCFFSNVTLSNCSIFCLTETWLCSSIGSSDYFPPCFEVHRRDRDSTPRSRTGGGVLVAVDRRYRSRRREDLEKFPESVWVEIEAAKGVRVLIGLFYLPPQTPPDEFHSCLVGIENTVNDLQGCEVLILGDFNAPGVNWPQLDVFTDNFYCRQKGTQLLNFSSFLNLKQHNNVLNHQFNALDLCFSNMDSVRVARGELPLVPQDTYHPALDIVLSFENSSVRAHSSDSPPHTSYNLSAGDYVGMHHYLTSFDWALILESPDVNDQVMLFTQTVRKAMDTFIPLRTVTKSRFPNWFSSELKTLLKRKDFFHRKFKKSGLLKWEVEFKNCRKQCKTVLDRDRQAHRCSVESDLVNNPKKFWKYINSRSGRHIESKIVLDNHESDLKSVPELFAEHFRSVYRDSTQRSAPVLPHLDGFGDLLSCINVDEESVRSCIKKMRATLSVGPDGIPSAILKTYHDIFTPVLCSIFNNSLRLGTFPETWKVAAVVPVLKSGKKGDICNYRPISLLSPFSKLFEMVVHQFLSFKFRNLAIPNQHGFMSGRSTTTNLVSFMSAASRVICNRGQLDVVYFDLSKAFDVVNHIILLSKLSSYGVCGSVHDWLKSYLSEREAYVRVNNMNSSLYRTRSGVPQGSVLGPLLFTIFVNDVSFAVLNSSFLQYADDIKIYREIVTERDCAKLQEDACSFYRWCSENDLFLNPSKTKVMTLSRKTHNISFAYNIQGETLSRVSVMKDLGVMVDSGLRFSDHVGRLVNSSLRMLGVASRLTREFKNPTAFITLYCSLSRSQLEYASVVWNGISKSHSLEIERVQKKFVSIFKHRYIKEDVHCLTYESALERVGLLSLHRRRENADLLFLFKTLHGLINSPSLLSELCLRVPRVPTRLLSSFYVSRMFSPVNPIVRMAQRLNHYSEKLDIFNPCYRTFVLSIKNLPVQDEHC